MPLALQSMSERRRCKISGEWLASAATVDQPNDNGERRANGKADQHPFQWIADRQPEDEAEQEKEGEETSSGERALRHRPRSGMSAAAAPALSREVSEREDQRRNARSILCLVRDEHVRHAAAPGPDA